MRAADYCDPGRCRGAKEGLASSPEQGQTEAHPTLGSKSHCHLSAPKRWQGVWSGALEPQKRHCLLPDPPPPPPHSSRSEGQPALQLPRKRFQLPRLEAWPCGKANRTLITSKNLELGPRRALRSQCI